MRALDYVTAGAALPKGLGAEIRMALHYGWTDYFSGQEDGPVRVLLRRRDSSTAWPASACWSAGDLATAVLPDRSPATFASVSANFDIELAEPFAPTRCTAPSVKPIAHSPEGASRTASGGTLLGLIDDGCPFAHSALRRSGGVGTRVVALWDQNPAPTNPSGRVKYGIEWGRGSLDSLMTHRSRAGSIDEAACYRDAGFDALAHRWTHGAHVAGRLAGSSLWGAGQRFDQTGEVTATDPAAEADLAFVQLPRDALLTVSPGAIAFHAFNAVAYLIRLARDLGYERLVVALAYDSWLGPHDATSWFERALDALVLESNESSLRVRVVLAAGNSARAAGHLELDWPGMIRMTPTMKFSPKFFLAADSELPTWVELWLPKDWKAEELRLSVIAPAPLMLAGSAALDSDGAWSSGEGPLLSVYGAVSGVAAGFRRRVLLRFAPTRAKSGRACAPHGLWILKIDALFCEKSVESKANAYVNRAGQLMYQPVFARQSRFALPRLRDYQRTLSGLAGGFQVIVAGAAYPSAFPYDGRLARRFATPRERVGPGRQTGYSGTPDGSIRRRLVDAHVPTEDGLLLPGQLGMSTRSGGVWRMNGTSVAVPTVARWLADLPSWPSDPGEVPSTPAGNLLSVVGA